MGKLADVFVEIFFNRKKLDDGLGSSEKFIKDFTEKANSLLGMVGMGLGVAGIARGIMQATEKGSDLIETMNKVDQVFGKSAGTVTGMATDMADKFGSVKNVTLSAAANLGMIAQGAGLSARASADLSVKLTRLADDASSFFNVPLDVALEKIRSGMVGEAEPLRAFGVLLSEASMKATGLEMGIRPVNGEFTESEKVMIRVEQITRGLMKAQGDHARTMDGYANQIRKVKGDWENLQAGVGSGISGAVATVGSRVSQKGIGGALMEGLEAFHGAVTGLASQGDTTMQRAADVGAGVQHIEGWKPALPGQPGGPPMPWLQQRMINDQRLMDQIRQKEWNANKFTGVGQTPFGMFGNLGTEMMAGAQKGELDFAIRQQQQRLTGWGGGHTMGSEAFMKQAQEKILQPRDEMGEKQLAELKAMRELLNKISTAKPIAPLGVRLNGRE